MLKEERMKRLGEEIKGIEKAEEWDIWYRICLFKELQWNEGTLLLYTVCAYNKTIIRKRNEVYKRIKNEYKRGKCWNRSWNYSHSNKLNTSHKNTVKICTWIKYTIKIK